MFQAGVVEKIKTFRDQKLFSPKIVQLMR